MGTVRITSLGLLLMDPGNDAIPCRCADTDKHTCADDGEGGWKGSGQARDNKKKEKKQKRKDQGGRRPPLSLLGAFFSSAVYSCRHFPLSIVFNSWDGFFNVFKNVPTAFWQQLAHVHFSFLCRDGSKSSLREEEQKREGVMRE